MVGRLLEKLRVRRNPDPRDWLFDMLPPRPACAEIGVWQGNFSNRILVLANPSVLYLIDPWSYAPDTGSPLYGNGSQAAMDEVHAGVRRRFASELKHNRVVIIRESSVAAAARIPDGALDLAYIDGDHRYEAVRADLIAYWPKVKKGGLLVADDYGEDHRWWGDGVTRAVDEFCTERGLAAVSKKDLQAVIRRE